MRLALLVLLLLPSQVYAMPPAIIAAAIGVSVATAEAISLGITIASIALTIGTTVYGAMAQKAAAKKAKRQAARARQDFLNSLQDRTVTRIATEAPHVYVYGRAKVGSAVVAVLSSGDNEEYKHLVCVHAAHECDAIEKIYIDGKELGPLDADGYVTTGDYFQSTKTENITETFTASPFTLTHSPSSAVKVIAYGRLMRGSTTVNANYSGEVPYTRLTNSFWITGTPSLNYRGVPTLFYDATFVLDHYSVTYQYQVNTSQVRVKKHLGTADDPADASLLAECGAKWKDTAVLRGFCYTVIRLDLRQAAFQGGLPSVDVLLRGKKLYDVRTGVTEWSQNPALVIYDYLTSEMCGVDASDLPTGHFITAANVCDEVQSFGALYTCNGTVTADQDQANVLDAMADSMAGGIVSTTWEVFAGKYVAPIGSLSQSDIVGALAVTPGISDADIINGVRGQNITAANLYVATDYKPYQNATYLEADGKDKYAPIDYPFTDTEQRVHNLARILVEDQRNGFTVKAEFSLKAWDYRVGDRVTFTSSFLGQTDKVYRVTDRKYSPDSSVELTIKEDGPTIWDLADTVTLDDTPNTDLPDPFIVRPLDFVTCYSGTDALLIQQDGTIISRILVSWGATSGAVVNIGQIEIEWKRDSDSAWRKTTATGSETAAYLGPVEDRSWYVIRVRAVNPYLNIKSDWTYAPLHQVVGKSEPPSDIADLSIDGTVLSWPEITDADRGGYIFRYHYGTNLDWGTANPLHKGIVTGPPFDLITLPYGAVTIMGKAVDTSRNESKNVAQIFTNLGDAPVANVVETHAISPTFAGTLDNCTVSAGTVIANAADSFYGDDAQSFYGLSADSFYKPSAGYGQMVYTTDEILITSALVGSRMTLDLVTQGIDVVVEYRLSGVGSFYGADSDPFYEADGDSFYGPTSGLWTAWPGWVSAQAAGYQFRITIGSGPTQGKITSMSLTIDAPDMVETVSDLTISSSGTAIPYTKAFTSIKVVHATLQANGSGAVTVEIDKSSPLAPTIKAYNSAHAAVSGAKADIFLQGY